MAALPPGSASVQDIICMEVEGWFLVNCEALNNCPKYGQFYHKVGHCRCKKLLGKKAIMLVLIRGMVKSKFLLIRRLMSDEHIKLEANQVEQI